MGQIGQLAPVAYVPNQNAEIQRAMKSMGELPVPEPEPTIFIDPNLLSDVWNMESLAPSNPM